MTEFIKINYPKFKFPDTNWYTYPYMDSTSKFYKLYRENENIPLYFASGDFDSDSLINYILYIGKGEVGDSVVTSYKYKYVLLHGSENGYKVFSFKFNQIYGGDLRYIENVIMIISPEDLKSTFSNRIGEKQIKHTLFVFASHLSVDCFYWDGEKYKMINYVLTK